MDKKNIIIAILVIIILAGISYFIYNRSNTLTVAQAKQLNPITKGIPTIETKVDLSQPGNS